MQFENFASIRALVLATEKGATCRAGGGSIGSSVTTEILGRQSMLPSGRVAAPAPQVTCSAGGAPGQHTPLRGAPSAPGACPPPGWRRPAATLNPPSPNAPPPGLQCSAITWIARGMAGAPAAPPLPPALLCQAVWSCRWQQAVHVTRLRMQSGGTEAGVPSSGWANLQQ